MPDTQTLGLLIAAMIAAAVCFRLYTVLGRRTGNETAPQPKPSPFAPPPAKAADAPAPSSSGLLDLQLADPGFDTTKFLTGARDAYARIVTAFAGGDRAALRPLLSSEVYAAFDAGITGRSTPAPVFTKLTDARIAGSAVHGRQAEITVAFAAEFSTGPVSDVWTFERNLDGGDPNWLLVATSGDAPQ
jgi:predicted lipid-binding transport protein (Tim44 family)